MDEDGGYHETNSGKSRQNTDGNQDVPKMAQGTEDRQNDHRHDLATIVASRFHRPFLQSVHRYLNSGRLQVADAPERFGDGA
jgi:hypothetical protein